MNFSVGGENMRDLFQMHTINLSVAVWVGFIALFGVATDDGVLMGTYIHQTFLQQNPTTKEAIPGGCRYSRSQTCTPGCHDNRHDADRPTAGTDFDRKRSGYHGPDGNTYFRRYVDPVHDYVCRSRPAMLVA